MSAILIQNARVLTMLAPGETHPPSSGRRSLQLGTLGVLPAADVLVVDGRVAEVRPHGSSNATDPSFAVELRTRIDAAGRILMPGFVDCHTHACWAGSRLDEWEKKLAGSTYQEIMAAGGGIMSTVRATRAATQAELARDLGGRLNRMLGLGSTTIEVKSGYGLMARHELKMLAAIQLAATVFSGTVVRTALIGHAIDSDAATSDEFVNQLLAGVWQSLCQEHRGVAVDAFCEKGAWSVEQCLRLFQQSRGLGHPIRVHADQFTSMGMVEKAIDLGACSVDHLEASTPETLQALAESNTFGVGLPVCGFHLDGRYAALGKLVDLGGKVCIATNYNPGSAPSPSMPFAIALAVRHCGLTPSQAIVAATLNPACLLGFADRGYIAPGARADLILLRTSDERELAYEVGDNPVETVIAGGVAVS